MKNLIIIGIGFFCLLGSIYAQDTIYTNENHNVALFFPDRLRQAIVGADHYVFSYNHEHPQFFGLLKGSPGKSSNLLAITQDGRVYSYHISYKEELPQFIHFLEEQNSVGSEIPETVQDSGAGKSFMIQNDKILDSLQYVETLKKRAAIYRNTVSGNLKRKKKDGIVLEAKEMLYDGNNAFMKFEIANHSGIDFEPEYLRVFHSIGTNRRNSSYQKILLEPILSCRFPERVVHGQRKSFVYVFPKFTLGDKERIELELREKKGNRLIKMKIKKLVVH